MENNKLIAEFMGYKLAKLYIGLAWESPYKNSVEDTFELHGRLWRENDSYYKFHTSWDWLMPVVMKISRKIDKPLDEVVSLLTEVGSDNIWGVKSLHNAVVEFIKNQNN